MLVNIYPIQKHLLYFKAFLLHKLFGCRGKFILLLAHINLKLHILILYLIFLFENFCVALFC